MNYFPSSVVVCEKQNFLKNFSVLQKIRSLPNCLTTPKRAYISARVWSSLAYKTNKMAVGEMLEQNQFVTDGSVKNNSKDTLSEKIR